MSKAMANAVATRRNGDLVPFMDPVEHQFYKRRVVFRAEIFLPSKAELVDGHRLDNHSFTEESRTREMDQCASSRGVIGQTELSILYSHYVKSPERTPKSTRSTHGNSPIQIFLQ